MSSGRSGFERQENGAGYSSGDEKSVARFHKEGWHIRSAIQDTWFFLVIRNY